MQRGLDVPRRSFTLYLTAKHTELSRVVLGFTRDDKLVLGVSVDDEGELPEKLVIARRWLRSLASDFGCLFGAIFVEEPPPDSEEAFLAALRGEVGILVDSFRVEQAGS